MTRNREALVVVESNGQFIDAWESLLKRYVWSLYGHLTFRGLPTERRASDVFRKWIHNLNRHLYGQHYWKNHSGLLWVRGEEVQRRGAVHYHVLVGHGPAAKFGKRLTAEFAQQLWSKMAGDGRVELYLPLRRGIAYLVKKYSPGYGQITLSSNMEAAPL